MDKQPAPAVGVSIVTDLPPGRQMTLQTFFPQDASDAEANKLIDRMAAFSNRQRAIASLPELREDLKRQETTLAQMLADFERIEAEHPVMIAALEQKAHEFNESAGRIAQSAFDRATADGRRVDPKTFKLKGAAEIEHRQAVLKHEEVLKEIDRLKTERSQGVDQHNINVPRFERAIAEHKAKIAEAEALVG